MEREAAGSGSQGAASSESAAALGRGEVGSGAAAVESVMTYESAADSAVSRSRGCVGGLGWL